MIVTILQVKIRGNVLQKVNGSPITKPDDLTVKKKWAIKQKDMEIKCVS